MSIFISYSRDDAEFADLLYRLLASKGYAVWMDRESLHPGSQWDIAIQQAVDAASHLVLILTPSAVASTSVTDEWSYALDQGKAIIPLMVTECTMPMRLRRVQWIDFITQGFADAFRSLTESLGVPDNRPTDPIELARREGLIFVDSRAAFGIAGVRVAFDYREYPQIGPFLNVVWQTLLCRAMEAHQYGKKWILKDRTTGAEYRTDGEWTRDSLLHEAGIEPGAQLTVILFDEADRIKGLQNSEPPL